MAGIYVALSNLGVKKLEIQLIFIPRISDVTIAIHSLGEFDGEVVRVSLQESGNPAF
jgi:hypothetical protein